MYLILSNNDFIEEDKFFITDEYLMLYVGNNTKIEDYFNDKKMIDSIYQEYLEYDDISKEDFINLINNIDFVDLDLDDVDIIDYIENNKILNNKKIVLKETVYSNEYDKILSLMKKYNKYLDRLYLKFEGDTVFTNIKKVFETVSIYKEEADRINSLDLSILEKVMYAYDITRNRYYVKEGEEEQYNVSRDLTSVTNGDKIVCVGFARIFKAILNNMGINSTLIDINRIDGKSGHCRNASYIKDPKYGIDGIYYFDTTWDCKKINKGNEFLNSYKYFAKTNDQIDELSSNYLQKIVVSNDLSKKFEKDLNKMISANLNTYEIFYNVVTKYKFINEISNIYNGKKIITEYGEYITNNCVYDKTRLISKTKELIKMVKEICSKINKEIDMKTMLELYSNVRKVEYSIDSNLYPYDIDSARKTIYNSKWPYPTDLYEKLVLDDMKKNKLFYIINLENKEELDKKNNEIIKEVIELILSDSKIFKDINNKKYIMKK